MSPYAAYGGLALVNLPILLTYGKLILGDFQGFLDSLAFWIKPDFMSWWDEKLFEDMWASFRLWFFVATCGAALAAEYAIVSPYLLAAAVPQ